MSFQIPNEIPGEIQSNHKDECECQSVPPDMFGWPVLLPRGSDLHIDLLASELKPFSNYHQVSWKSVNWVVRSLVLIKVMQVKA